MGYCQVNLILGKNFVLHSRSATISDLCVRVRRSTITFTLTQLQVLSWLLVTSESPSMLLLGRSPMEAQGFSNIWKETKKAQTWGLKVPPGEARLLPSGCWVLQRTFQSPCCRPQGPAGPWMPHDSVARALTDVKCSLVNDELWGCCQVLLENISSNEGQKAFQISHRGKTYSKEIFPGLGRQITRRNQEQEEKSSIRRAGVTAPGYKQLENPPLGRMEKVLEGSLKDKAVSINTLFFAFSILTPASVSEPPSPTATQKENFAPKQIGLGVIPGHGWQGNTA